MWRLLLAAAFLVFAPAVDAWGQDAFARANELYRREDFAGAEALYREVLAADPRSVAARYNLGNALYRQGRLGGALQHYLGALRRAPRDARARRNVTVVRARLTEELPPAEAAVVAGPLQPPLGWLSAAEIAWAAVGALYALALTGAVAILRPRACRVAAVGAVVIFLAAAAFAMAAARSWALRPQAVVVVHSAGARGGPGTSEPVVLTLPEGAGLRVRGQREGWVFASLPNGLSGWIPADDIGRVP